MFDLAGELWVRDFRMNDYIRLIPRSGIELCGEQNLSLSSARSGLRTMYKLRPQYSVQARDDYHSRTVYVPSPDSASFAGPSNWLWAAAANRAYVDAAVTSAPARSLWDSRYYQRVPVPASRSAPGAPGDLACDGTNLYLYHSRQSGWLRIRSDPAW